MTTAGHRRRRLAGLTLATAAVPLLAGCFSMGMVRGQPGADLGAVREGARRVDVELHLGPPVRRWTTSAGVEYRLYRYDGGVPPDRAAVLLVVIDVLSLGLPSLLDELEKEGSGRPPGYVDPARLRNLAVAYDADGVVLGVFVNVGEFETLPDDGKRPTSR